MSLPAVTARPDGTRARILETALELFAAQGFAATTTRELSERLGFTKAALYYHFRTKDELLQALVEPVVAQLTALLGPHPHDELPLDRAARGRLLAGYLDVVVAHRRLLGVLVQDPSAAQRPALEAGRAFHERLTELLSGTRDPSTEERTRLRFVLGGLHAAVLFAEPEEDVASIGTAALAAGRELLGLGQE